MAAAGQPQEGDADGEAARAENQLHHGGDDQRQPQDQSGALEDTRDMEDTERTYRTEKRHRGDTEGEQLLMMDSVEDSEAKVPKHILSIQ